MLKTQCQRKQSSFAVPANKETAKKRNSTQINMNSGSTLYIIESDNACAIRMIRKMMDNEKFSDNDFRHYVHTLLTKNIET